MIVWLLAFALAQDVAPTKPEVAEITVWGDLAVQRSRTGVVRDMESLGYKKRKEQDGEVVFTPPSSWMGKAYLDYDGNLSFGRPVLGLQKVEAYEYQSAAEGAQQNSNLSRSPGGLADPNGGAGYVAPHPTGSFWLLPSRRLLETTQQQVIDKMASSLLDYREVVVETRKHQ